MRRAPIVSHRISWINPPVLIKAIERYEQGRLPRSLTLWLQTSLSLMVPPQGPCSLAAEATPLASCRIRRAAMAAP